MDKISHLGESFRMELSGPNHTQLCEHASFCLTEICSVQIEGSISQSKLFFFDLYYWLSNLICIFIGLPLNAAIVCYEWYGCDPQKRSLVNRFTSNGLISGTLAAIASQIFTGLLRYDAKLQNLLRTLLCIFSY